jgi:hypothetical protein
LHSENAADEKPLLREVFRDLDVTRRYTLKPISDGQYIMRDFDALETRASKLKKREKRKNRALKTVEMGQKVQK